jgi:hypothetical protein
MILTYGIAGVMMRTATELTYEQKLIQLNFCVMLCPSVRLHVSARLLLDGFPCNLVFRDFYENPFKKNPYLVNLVKSYRALYMSSSFIVTGDIISPQKRSFKVEWYQPLRISDGV